MGFPHLDNQCNTLTTDGSSPSDSLSSYIKSTLDPGDSVEMRTSQSNSTMDGRSLGSSRGVACVGIK